MPEHNELIRIIYEPENFAFSVSLRLDQFLAAVLKQFSRAQLQRLINQQQVLVDGKARKASYGLRPGQEIELTVPPAVSSIIEAEEMPLDIVYEDEYLAVVNKAAGMVVHPGAGVHSGTLVHGLLHHMQDSLSGIGGVLRPGIVHRLDKDTSGLLVIAKADRIHQHLAKQIQNKEAKRTYIAILEGAMPKASGLVNAPVGRHPTRRTEMAIVKGGRAAQTTYTVLASAQTGANNKRSIFSLVKVDLKTGRTHQIRVHMASLNCPVVGDLVYNHKATGNASTREKFGLTGQALHAYLLSFQHPISNQWLEFKVALPADWSKLMSSIYPTVNLQTLPL